MSAMRCMVSEIRYACRKLVLAYGVDEVAYGKNLLLTCLINYMPPTCGHA